MWKLLYILNLLYCMASAVTYKTYQAEPATEQEIAEYNKNNNAGICISTFDPCVEDEWRRLNGSCNNLDHPSLGAYHTPIWRMLDAHYSEGYEPRKTKSGKDFPLARYLRRFLLLVGETMNQWITQSATYFLEFSFLDVGSVHDVELYIFHKTYCCEKEGQCDRECAPNYIPYDDSTHRFSDIKCFNMTRPMSFQQKGCVADGSVPMRPNYATVSFDISNIYYHVTESDKINRAFEGGLLKVEIVNGRIYPSDANETTTCFIKDAVKTGCTRTVPNGLVGTNLCSVWFWRLHNHIARGLAAVNPHWTDEQLYHTARDINIAYYSQILFYESFALMLGRENLIRDGVLGRRNGFRDPYRKNVLPGIALEYSYILRWFHMTQDTQQRMYDKHDNYVNTFPVLNVTFRVQDLAIGDNMVGLTHGSYIQPGGGFDQVAHPEMVEVGLGHHLAKAFDVLSADLSRGRYFGIAPYTKYRDMCTGYKIKHETFEDLRYLMSDTKIDELRKMYEHVDDIEFLAGVWAEDLMEGTWVTPTVYSLIVKQLQRSVASDRHWYERPNRPHAFNRQQLKQIRQASFAGMLCIVGDDVTEIQPRAFETIRDGNYKVSCDKIPQLNFEFWREERRGGRWRDC